MGTSRSRREIRKYIRSWNRPAGQHNLQTPILKLPTEISQQILRHTVTDQDIRNDISNPFDLYKMYNKLRRVCWKWNAEMPWVMHKWEQRRDEIIKKKGFKLTKKWKHMRFRILLARTLVDEEQNREEFRAHQMRLAKQKAKKKRRERKRCLRLKREWIEAKEKKQKERMVRMEIKWRRGAKKHYNSMVKQTLDSVNKYGVRVVAQSRRWRRRR